MKKFGIVLLAVVPVLFILVGCGKVEKDENPPYYDQATELMLQTREKVFAEMGLDLQPILFFDTISDKLCGVAYRQIFFQTSKAKIEETNSLVEQLFRIYGEPDSNEDIETKNQKRLAQIDLRELASEGKSVGMEDYWLLDDDNMLFTVAISANQEWGTISVMMHYKHVTEEFMDELIHSTRYQ